MSEGKALGAGVSPIMQFDYNKEEKAVREHFPGTREGMVHVSAYVLMAGLRFNF